MMIRAMPQRERLRRRRAAAAAPSAMPMSESYGERSDMPLMLRAVIACAYADMHCRYMAMMIERVMVTLMSAMPSEYVVTQLIIFVDAGFMLLMPYAMAADAEICFMPP